MGNAPKVLVDGFKWLKYTSQFNKNYIEHFNKDSDAGYFLESDVLQSKELHALCNDLLFWKKFKNS